MSHSHSSFSIRAATEADLPAILDIEHLSFEHAGERFAERKIRGLLGKRRTVAVVAESAGTVAGWACGFVSQSGGQTWGRIYAIAVHPQQRGQRLGPALLQYILDALRGRGAAKILLEVRADNHAALKLYQRHGFAVVGRLENFYALGVSALRMSTEPGRTEPLSQASGILPP
jgi:[ribosomal protein S18]-alanine N-acetyltransferase